jgi:hypothetical protein
MSARHAATRRPRAMTSIDFWGELDDDVLRCLSEKGDELSPAEVGYRVGLSEGAARSVLMMLPEAGKVRICSVAYIPDAERRIPVR